MPHAPIHSCPHAADVETLARDALLSEDRLREQRHLEECESCLALFHQRTAVNFPSIPQYTIVERVGEGGFGIVYKAVHHQKRRTEALKVLFGETKQRAAYFENEVHLVARLKHDTIATLYEAHLGSSPAYYSMEFVEGHRLDEHLAEGRLTLAQRIRIVRDVAHAIGYAHEQGVVHRDIKPQNILIDLAGRPRIVDFGIGRRLGLTERASPDGEQSPEGPIGTFGYMSPEQSEGKRVDARADVYSLGALLYFTVTGDPPRRMRPSDNLALQFTARGIPRAAELAAIIRRCLEFAPERRYAGCVELVADLDSFLIGWPTSVGAGGSPLYRARRIAEFALRRHTLAARITVTLLAVILLAALHWTAGTRVIAATGPAAAHPTPTPDHRDSGAYIPVSVVEESRSGAESVTLVAYTDSTDEHLRRGLIEGFDPDAAATRSTRRRLHAALLDRLAVARPSVVVFDHFYRECMPEVDDRLIASIQAAGAPVVVGAARFDVNSRPDICPHIADSVYAWGALVSAGPGDLTDELAVLAIQRGFEPPVPSLAIAALAAWRQPEAVPSLALEPEARRLHIRYRRRAETPGQSRWLAESDTIPLTNVARFRGSDNVSPRDADDPAPSDAVLASHASAQRSMHDGEGALRLNDVVARARFPVFRDVRGGRLRSADDRSPSETGELKPDEREKSVSSDALGDVGHATPGPRPVSITRPPVAAASSQIQRSGLAIVPLEAALAADDAQAANWFSGKAVIVGQMSGSADRHKLPDGSFVYGVEIQARILRLLLLGQTPTALSRADILARLSFWSIVAAILASFATRTTKVRRASEPRHERIRPPPVAALDEQTNASPTDRPDRHAGFPAAPPIVARPRIVPSSSTVASSPKNPLTGVEPNEIAEDVGSSAADPVRVAPPSAFRAPNRATFAIGRSTTAAPSALAALALVAASVGVTISGYAAMSLTSRWSLEAALAAGAVLTVGGVNLLISAVRNRQERLSPDLVYPLTSATANDATTVRAP